MPDRTFISLTGVALAALIVVLVVLTSPAEPELIPETMDGDIEEVVARIDLDEMAEQARALLATDRPWRAAEVMRAYLQQADHVAPDERLLAARAEAGWGAWDAVAALLEDVPALERLDHGIGLYLLARARDAAGDAAAAADLYRAFLALSALDARLEREVARLRLGLALIRSGAPEAGRRELAAVAETAGAATTWFRLLEAYAHADRGDTETVRSLVSGYTSGIPGLHAWRARIHAAWQAGDVAAARALANQAREWARTDATRGEFFVAAARAAIALGDVNAARGALRSAVARQAAGQHARDPTSTGIFA